MSYPVGPTQPSIGRIVHIVHPQGIDVPGIVTAVLGSDGTIACTAFVPGSAIPIAVDQCEHVEPTPAMPNAPIGSWHWPPLAR